MDRSFLSHKDVIAASRDFVCVRPASYMDEDEAKFMMNLIRTRSGNPDNTNFVILTPDGKKALVRGSRSPRMTYGTVEKMVASMTEIAAKHPGKKSVKLNALPAYKDLRLSLDVASCDLRPLVVIYSKDKRRTDALAKTLGSLAWSDDFVGRFHYIVESDKSKLDVLTKFPDGTHVAVIHPGEFGLTGKVLETTGESSSARLQELLADGLEAYQPEDKNPRTHVRNGQRSGKQWETDLPVTGARASERPGNQ
ncbi:MAG TPA: hypothetical protein EYF98_04410 [Planctomycetes bacterium]|nr:hypothetical protein [Planctomycetota bacterium]